jgi:hypothetical protein
MAGKGEKDAADRNQQGRCGRERCRQQRRKQQEGAVGADRGRGEQRELFAGEPECEPVLEFDVGRQLDGSHLEPSAQQA